MVSRLVKLPKNNSFFLFGARGVGKTSLIKSQFSPGQEVLFIDLLNEDLFEKYSLSPQILKSEIDALETKPNWIVLDEVQRVPKLLNIAHQLIESSDKIKFVLSGSSSRRLKQKGVNLLAGRAWLRYLHPFTFIEIGKNFSLEQTINWGSLPKIFSLEHNPDKADYLKAYALTYIKSEIQEEQWVRKLEPFRKFLPIAAQMNGKPLNYSKISREVGVEVPTIKSYYEILDDTLLGFHLPAHHKSLRKQERVAPKFYFHDLGVKKSLQKTLDVKLTPQTSEWGQAFEHLIICEFHRLNDYFNKDFQFFYYQTKDNFKVDLVIERPQKPLVYIEIKSAKQIFPDEFLKFSNFVNQQKAIGYVLSNDPGQYLAHDIKFLDWQTGLKEIFEVEANS
jgi:uncharacterized protein